MQQHPNADWNEFNQEYFCGRLNNLKKETLFRYFNAAKAFLKNYQLREPDKKRYNGILILLGTVGNEDPYHYLDTFREIFPNAQEHVFTESGG